jgi:hypothetical protein
LLEINRLEYPERELVTLIDEQAARLAKRFRRAQYYMPGVADDDIEAPAKREESNGKYGSSRHHQKQIMMPGT